MGLLRVVYRDRWGSIAKLTTAAGPYAANRVAALLSKMFALSIRWDMRADNPARGIARNHEKRRYRYLMPIEGLAAASDVTPLAVYERGRCAVLDHFGHQKY
jgi:hypothetical protein